MDKIVNYISYINSPDPFYLIDIDSIKKNSISFLTCWKKYFEVELYYSYKTNPLLPVVKAIHACGYGAEVVNEVEIDWALSAQSEPKLIFNGINKTESSLRKTLKSGSIIFLDSLYELKKLMPLLSKYKKHVQNIGLRLSVKNVNGKPSVFGLSILDAIHVIKVLKQNEINVTIIGFHPGSGLQTSDRHLQAIHEILPLIRELLKHNAKISLSLGGGYPSAHTFCLTNLVEIFSIWENFALAVSSLFQISNIDQNRLKILVEPGTALVEDCGYLVATIKQIKYVDKEPFLFVDIGTNLIPSVKTRFHDIIFLKISAKQNSYSIKGNLCYESDILFSQILGAEQVEVGEKIIITGVNSYDIPNSYLWCEREVPIYYIENAKLIFEQSPSRKNKMTMS